MKKGKTVTINEVLINKISENNPWRNFSNAMETALTRYYNILDYGLREIELSENEWTAIYHCTNGMMNDSNDIAIRMMWANVEDAERYDKISTIYNIDADKLVEKLKNASMATLYAIFDKAERHWFKANANTSDDNE